MRDVCFSRLSFSLNAGLLVGLALAFGCSCALGAFGGFTLGLLGPALGFQLLALCLFGLQLQFQLAAFCCGLGVCFTLGCCVTLGLCALLCFALGLLGGFPGDALLAILLLCLLYTSDAADE